MAPEYGATMGFFPVDEKTVDYFRTTGRTDEQVAAIETYFKAQGMFGMPKLGDIDYSEIIELDLDQHRAQPVRPETPAGPRQLPELGRGFDETVLRRPIRQERLRRAPRPISTAA